MNAKGSQNFTNTFRPTLEFNHLHDTESCIAENALKISADDATQVNFPESYFFVFQIWSVPSSSTFDLPNGSSLFSLTHVTFGLGSPLAWQETETLRCLSTSRSEGGRTLNLGSCTTLRCVTAEACLNWFDAIHLYMPESLFCQFSNDSCPPFRTALPCSILPCTLDHVITAEGNLVTWHSGSVIFFSFST